MFFFDDLDRYSRNVAVITDDSKELRYRHLTETADDVARKIGSRCLVFLVCKNCFASVAAYIGLLRTRAVQALIHHRIDGVLFAQLLERYKPEYIFLPTEISVSDPTFNVVDSFDGYTLLKTGYERDYALHDDLAVLLSTSGSTGSQRFVRQSYKNVNCNAEAIAEYLEISCADRPITTMPMGYTYALSIINSHLVKGSSIILTEATLMEKRFWDAVRDNGATTFGGVPYIFEMLKKLRFEQMHLETLRYITQAGGKLNRTLSSEFADMCTNKGIRFFVMYGQTEATARMSYLPWEYARTKVGSVGVAIPGGTLWLVDENGNVIEEKETVGELVYRGDNVTMGYAEGRADLENGDENNGILRTGDLAKRDEDGFYYITGRKKRFLKMYGNRINLDEIDELLNAAGYDCVCGGTDDHLKIYTSERDDEEEIVDYISKLTGINRAGLSSEYIERIPRNESGKVRYSELG